jgi:hypothetical protein
LNHYGYPRILSSISKSAKGRKEDKPWQVKQDQKLTQKQEPLINDKIIIYQENSFTLNLLEDWEDKTLYTLTGPVTDGIQHNVIINLGKETNFETLKEYAEW